MYLLNLMLFQTQTLLFIFETHEDIFYETWEISVSQLNVHSTKTSMFQTVHNEIVEVIYMLNWKWLEQTPHYSNRSHPYLDSSTHKSTNMLCNTSTAPFMSAHAPFSWLATGVLRSNRLSTVFLRNHLLYF